MNWRFSNAAYTLFSQPTIRIRSTDVALHYAFQQVMIAKIFISETLDKLSETKIFDTCSGNEKKTQFPVCENVNIFTNSVSKLITVNCKNTLSYVKQKTLFNKLGSFDAPKVNLALSV